MTNSEQKKIIDKIKIILNDQDQNSHIHKLLEIEKDYPNDVAIKQAISQTYLKMDENTKALEYINEADKLSPGNYAIKYNLGMMHKKFKKYDEAINFFKESVKLNSIFKFTLFAFFLAIMFNSSEGSIPITLFTVSEL